MANQKPIRVKHPDFGYVEFHGLSLRQIDVLNKIKKDARQDSGTSKSKTTRQKSGRN
jgi:hypothetical protein